MKKLIITLALCLPALVTLAQEFSPDTVRLLAASRKPVVVMKLAPLTLFELQNTFELGAEVRLHDRMSIQGQAGYAPDWLIWKSSDQSGNQYTNRENWRGRLETRWYVNRRNRAGQLSKGGYFPLGGYIAVDALYKQLNAQNTLTIGHECTFGCAYYEKTVEPITRYIGGLGVKFGAQTVIGRSRSAGIPSWLLDIYLGFGVRRGWTEQRALEPDERRFSNRGGFLSIDPFQAANQLTPNLLMGIKIGYAL